MEKAITVMDIPKIDTWVPEESDKIFTTTKGAIFAPVSDLYQGNDLDELNVFYMGSKNCYNKLAMREHTCAYLNYFEKYFDPDRELFVIMSRIKYMIDMYPEYGKDSYLYDIRVYILCDSLVAKVMKLVEYNYSLALDYRNISTALQYTDDHAKKLLAMSVMMNFCIPLITHFAKVHVVGEIDEFIMENFDIVLHLFPVDMYAKLYETAISFVERSAAKNQILWGKQDIRGKDTTTHSYASVNNIVLNIMPKYTFDRSIVALNCTSIQVNTNRQIIDIEYEYNFIPLSSSKRDEDNVSDFDKFEGNLIKQNEAVYIQLKCNAAETMKTIESLFGPFSTSEINFYKNELSNLDGNPINNFQKQLIFNMFYKYFGDTVSIYAINSIDYIKLMLAAKKILKDNYMTLLPYIVSGKIEKLVGRKTVNKKEMIKVQVSDYYELVYNKYRNPKIIKQVLSTIATVISSDFRVIDYNDRGLNGKMVETVPDIIIEEFLAYTMLI